MTTVFIGEYGLGFGIVPQGGQTYFAHGGADEGFQCYLIVHRDRGYGAAVMANSDNGINLAMEIVRGLAREHRWDGYLPAPLKTRALSARKLAPLAGRYQLNGDEAFALEARGNRLFGKPQAGEEYELFAIAEDLFVRKERQMRYRVERTKGQVTGVTVLAGREAVPARRMAPGATLPWDELAAGRVDAPSPSTVRSSRPTRRTRAWPSAA